MILQLMQELRQRRFVHLMLRVACNEETDRYDEEEGGTNFLQTLDAHTARNFNLR